MDASMEGSHNHNADNSRAKRRAEAAMADRQWSAALSAWKTWWDEEGQQPQEWDEDEEPEWDEEEQQQHR